MPNSTDQPGPHPSAGSGLETISSDIIASFRAEPHDLGKLFDTIKNNSPALAEFLLGRAQELAPGDPRVKQLAAQLALEVLGIVAAKEEAARLDAEFGLDN